MAKPDISAFLALQTFAGTPVRSEWIAEYVYDRPLKQHLWRFSAFVVKEFVPVDAFGYLTEMEQNPRNTKESLFIIKVLANPTTVDGGGSVVTGAVGHVGIDELEKSDDFTDVIRLTALVGTDYGNAPGSYTYKAQAYTLSDYELLNEDTHHKRLVAIYRKTARTENSKKWDDSYGGAVMDVTRVGSTTIGVLSPTFLTTSSETKENTDGSWTTVNVTNPDGVWPTLVSKKVDDQGNLMQVDKKTVETGTVTPSVSVDATYVYKTEFTQLDKLRDQKVYTIEVLQGPVLTSNDFDEQGNLRILSTQNVKRGSVTPSVLADSANVVFTMFDKLDPYRDSKIVRTEVLQGPVYTKVSLGKLDDLEVETSQIVKRGSVSSGIAIGSDIVTFTTYDKVDPYRDVKFERAESTRGPALDKSEITELDTVKNIVTQVIPNGDSETGVGKVKTGSNIVETEFEQIDTWRKQKVVSTEPVEGPVIEGRKFNQFDNVQTETKQIIDKTSAVAEATYVAGVLTTKDFQGVDTIRAEQNIRAEELTGPILYESKYNQELANFTLVSKQVIPNPDLLADAELNTVTTESSGGSVVAYIVCERQDLDRWRTLKIKSKMDVSALSGTTIKYKMWSGYTKVDLPPEVTAVNWASAESTSGDAADFNFTVGFELRRFDRTFPCKFYRFYTTKPDQTVLDNCLALTGAVATQTGVITSKLLDYKVIQKDIMMAYSYWGGNTAVQTISTPNAYWDQTINFSINPSPPEHKVNFYPGTTTVDPNDTLAILGTDFTARPTVKKIVSVKPQEWFGNLWIIDMIEVDFADLP